MRMPTLGSPSCIAARSSMCETGSRTGPAKPSGRSPSRTAAPADVAAELGLGPNSVRQAKSRILRRLKEELGELIA
jgi:hypothetical protein